MSELTAIHATSISIPQACRVLGLAPSTLRRAEVRARMGIKMGTRPLNCFDERLVFVDTASVLAHRSKRLATEKMRAGGEEISTPPTL